ncbi:BON domain-containing protein [Trinickia caryophylli]|uniref:Osmotically-inducible protein OsmY, contains BON domain n=1 Tax=Trinickia caryophylli TaxID=28094 RepID=A0A1X7FHZ4_TRICW|nr:BON domain-containing protein [Trinickia caryophylli]PMS13226.1 BON domain-containing protein [Trinickia caryophylli]TRX19249.1 BON domain-containing protein [Trinickia caryophylli]WQE13452.1 BON domain-containing protein [Trinickia caryophylli]SMF52547.1 Osmotically-inducible protein OsmY, contains BON domain [Trinickia caryophylli]GLU34023.1 transporter [Trinickia caryophylli]
MKANRVTKTLVRALLAAGLAASLGVTLQGCVLLAAGAAGGGALMATDRRTLGTQTEDREIQVKGYSQIANEFPESAHVDVTVFNRRVLLTGEVPDEAARQRAEAIVKGLPNVDAVINELVIGPKSTFSERANDSYLVARVKGGLVAEKGISANDFKVVSERGNLYLMGLVTKDEGDIGADVASRVPGVVKVVKVFQYVQPEEAAAVAASGAGAANAPSSAQSAQAEPTVGAVPSSTITAQPLQQQAPAPVSDSTQVHPKTGK